MKGAAAMKDPKFKMSLLMSITLGFFMSLTGLLSSMQFTLPAFLSNLVISFIIGMIVGAFVDMRKITDSFEKRYNIPPHTMKARAFDALLSDLIYTPIMTVCMVTMAYFQAVKHGTRLFYPAMLLKSLVISLIVGYLLIFIFMPLFVKIVFKGKINKPRE